MKDGGDICGPLFEFFGSVAWHLRDFSGFFWDSWWLLEVCGSSITITERWLGFLQTDSGFVGPFSSSLDLWTLVRIAEGFFRDFCPFFLRHCLILTALL